MNELQIRRWMRGECGKMGWTLLIYNMIMSTAVTAVCMVDALIKTVMHSLEGTGEDLADIYANALSDSMTSNAWGYIFAMLLGWGILLLWKKKQFCLREIWQLKKPMTCSVFFRILFVFLSGQAVFQVIAIALESLFSLFGMSVMGPIESASAMGDSFSMFLYIGLFAPIGEEILFRGLILRSLQPFGKKFAILASAILFGLFHGNIVQSPYAFVVGLVLARLLSPEEYGLIGICLIFTTVLNGIVDSGFSNAIIRKKDATNEDYNTMFITNMVISVVLYVLLYFSAPLISAFFALELTTLVRAIGLVLIINALSLT
jgi:membrane protease YdiL (CAAX protease family)